MPSPSLPGYRHQPDCRFLMACCVLMACLLGLFSRPASATDTEITVSAAASLNNALKKIASLYEVRHPGTRINLNFAASGILLQQLIQGAPVDVFASADQATMDQAADKGLIIPDSRHDFASTRLVIIQPRGTDTLLRQSQDLTDPAIRRIAMGNPDSVPAGRYTRQELQSTGLWKHLQSRYIYAQNVRQVLDYVARNEVDAGFVYKTDAFLMPGKVDIVPASLNHHDPVRYPAAVVSHSNTIAAARSFVDFLLSPEAQTILHEFGFELP